MRLYISSFKHGKDKCPECKGIAEEVLESAFVESYRINTDDHKDVLEEVLQRTEEILPPKIVKNCCHSQITEQIV